MTSEDTGASGPHRPSRMLLRMRLWLAKAQLFLQRVELARLDRRIKWETDERDRLARELAEMPVPVPDDASEDGRGE